jgi:hypothetical protein
MPELPILCILDPSAAVADIVWVRRAVHHNAYICAAQILLAARWGSPPSLSAGLILLACCPGGTASNVVRLLSAEFSFSRSMFLFRLRIIAPISIIVF